MSRISELSLSDLNHELGKAKESLLYGSSQYVQNFRTDATQVGSMIRSESTRFGDYMKPKMATSTSMPVIQDRQNMGSLINHHNAEKYHYRSRPLGDNFSPVLSPIDTLEESVVAKFIRVVGATDDESGDNTAKNSSSKSVKPKRRPTVHTKEDILKQLTDFHEEEEEKETEDHTKDNENDDLEICFINEMLPIDDTEALDDDPIVNNSNNYSLDNKLCLEQSDIKNNSEDSESDNEEVIPYWGVGAIQQFELEKKRIKESACHALAQCHQIARSQVAQERQVRRGSICRTIKDIIGMDYTELNETCLRDMNVSSLQVIVNDMTESIELYNKELMQLLISKDELQIEQESMLMDIGDILQNH